MDDVRFRLQLAADANEFRAHDDRPEALEHPRPDNDVGDALLVLQRQEDRIALARPLPHQNQPGHRNAPAIRHRGQTRIRRDADAIEPLAQEGHRMRLQRKAERAVVVDDMLAERHARQLRLRLIVAQARLRLVEQRQPFGGTLAVERPHRPQALRAGRGRASGRRRPRPAVRSRRHRARSAARHRAPNHSPRRAARRMLPCASFGQSLDLAKAKPDGVAGPDDAAHFGMAFGRCGAGRRRASSSVQSQSE